MLFAALVLALPSLTPTAPELEHGKLPWFEGTYTELIAAAKAADKPVMIDLWTTWCGWCKRLDRVTFSDPEVLAALEGFLVWNADAERPEGGRVARRFKVASYPTLVFLDPDGSPRDLLKGYLPPAAFKAEALRLLRNEDTISGYLARIATDPADLDARIGLAKKYEQFGDVLGRQRELREIERLDPQGETRAGEHGRLEREKNEILANWQRTREIDTSKLEAFLAASKYADVRHAGWLHIATTRYRESKQLAEKATGERLSELRKLSRTAFEAAWRDCPEAERVSAGVDLLGAYCETFDLTPQQKTFALGVGRALAAAAPEDPPALDALSLAQQASGDWTGALATMRRCVELEPENPRWTRRLSQLDPSVD